MPSAPKPSELFSDATSNAERAERFEAYKESLSEAYKSATSGGMRYVEGEGFRKNTRRDNSDATAKIEQLRELSKGVSGDAAASIQATLNEMQADLVKEIDSNPPTLGNTALGQTAGFVPIDLESPSKKLVPRETPLRNMLPRNNSGKGTGVSFRRVRGWSNSNSSTGAVGDMSSFFSSEQEQAAYGGVSFRRPAQISYATDVNTVAYVEQGLGTSVSWRTQYAGQGYEDIRQLSQTALLYSTMQAEEKNLLMGRGSTASGYTGTINGGVGPAGSLFTATPSATGGSLAAGTTYAFYFTYSTGNGETAVGAGITGVTTTGSTSKITLSVTSAATVFAAGAQGINVYFNSTATSTTAQYVGTLVPNSASTLTVTVLPSGAATPAAADASFNAFGYDGLLTMLSNTASGTGQQTGYFSQFSGSGTTGISGVGDAPFQTAFEVLYGASTMPNSSNLYTGTYVQAQGAAFGQKLLADPDTILLDGTIRSALGQYLKANASTSAYRIMLTEGGVNGEKIGAVVNGIYNQVTGKPVDLVVEPYMPPGSSVIWSKTLPVPDSEVSNTFEVRNVQDYMMYEWAPTGMTWDASTYMFGSLIGYAPAWSGSITGLLP
jgi:hypothetical protein